MSGAVHGDGEIETWPGVFTGHLLHRVTAENAERLRFGQRIFGVAECGAVCVPAAPVRGRKRCPMCFPRPEDDNANPKTEGQTVRKRPRLPKRIPRTVPRPNIGDHPTSGWFTSFDENGGI